MLIDLDTPAGRDPVRVGAKAAALGAARSAGVPVLPGFVVDGSASRAHMELGAETLALRGSGGARLAVGGAPLEFAERLVEAGSRLGERLVARSSSLLESSGEWAGAFTSYVDIGPIDLPKAVVGCWASAFSVDALERQASSHVEPGSFPMSVLVQPALDPAAGGWAEVVAGEVLVHGVKGSPSPLLQGWVTGSEARHTGSWSGEELIELVGLETLESIRSVLGAAHAELGADRCEWALADRVWVLQLGRADAVSAPPAYVIVADLPDRVVDIARTVVLAPGALGEELVIPWAIAGLPEVEVAARPGTDLVTRARELAGELTAEVWGLPRARADEASRELMRSLRGGIDDNVISRLGSLCPPDPGKAARLLGMLHTIRDKAVEEGLAPNQRAAWHVRSGTIESGLQGKPAPVTPRVGIGRWEPMVAAVTLSSSAPTHGIAASAGLGAGRRVEIGDPHQRRADRRGVVTAEQPIPNLASLLWDASGLVTKSGSPAAHLFEAARALRVPAVCGVDLGDTRDEVVAVDGHAGAVATLSLDREL